MLLETQECAMTTTWSGSRNRWISHWQILRRWPARGRRSLVLETCWNHMLVGLPALDTPLSTHFLESQWVETCWNMFTCCNSIFGRHESSHAIIFKFTKNRLGYVRVKWQSKTLSQIIQASNFSGPPTTCCGSTSAWPTPTARASWTSSDNAALLLTSWRCPKRNAKRCPKRNAKNKNHLKDHLGSSNWLMLMCFFFFKFWFSCHQNFGLMGVSLVFMSPKFGLLWSQQKTSDFGLDPGVGCEDRIKAVHLPVMFHEVPWVHRCSESMWVTFSRFGIVNLFQIVLHIFILLINKLSIYLYIYIYFHKYRWLNYYMSLAPHSAVVKLFKKRSYVPSLQPIPPTERHRM